MATGNPKAKWISENLSSLSVGVPQVGVTLSYEGKLSANDIIATKPAKTMPIWEGSAQSVNRLYYGDNLPLLAALLRDDSVRGKVKLIYIDPPFSTNSVFHSRAQTDAYQDLLVGAHFVEFIRQRLILLRELLAEDGSIEAV
jgi:adenine-specific DNA-methyltransferase